jgi:enamine deaminase RidA (YjgF/YER057c/UK114 family)
VASSRPPQRAAAGAGTASIKRGDRRQVGITLPPVAVPAAAYVPFVRTGNLVFISGHIAKRKTASPGSASSA